MTSNYSIELEAENIQNSNTKEYFKEVLSSYINGNYRSALVSLWTVTVCDLIYKLQELKDTYEDKNAKNILKEIMELQEKDRTSPTWETTLIDKIENKQMFETYQIADIRALKIKRHLSAHPVIKNNLELYKPNKETARAFIRNTLESILTVPATMISKEDAFKNLIHDIEIKEVQSFLPHELKKFLNKKYFSNFSKPVKEYVFRELWKFIFKLDTKEAEKNQNNNFLAIKILYMNNQELLNNFLKNNTLYFLEKTDINKKGMSNHHLIKFLSEYPKIYSLLDKTLQMMIKKMIDKSEEFSLGALFLKNNPKEYLKEIEENIEVIEKSKGLSVWILEYAKDNKLENELISLYMNQYINSSNFNDADNRFDSFIKPIIDLLDSTKIKFLLEKIEDNGQIYGRTRNIEETHLLIKERINNINDTFDYSPYPNFLRSIRWKEV